jgi:hypothetical protein
MKKNKPSVLNFKLSQWEDIVLLSNSLVFLLGPFTYITPVE